MKPILKKIITAVALLLILVIAFMGFTMVKIKSETALMDTIETSEVIPGIYAIQDDFANMFLIENNGKYIAFDGGKNIQKVNAELKKLKIKPEDVEAIFLTHTDNDHVAAVDIFKNAQVYISSEEEQMIDGTTNRMFIFKNKLKAPYLLIDDQQSVNINGITIKGILTIGHTPGAMCFQVNKKHLFTGDLMSIKDGKSAPFNDFFNMDSETSSESLDKIKNLNDVEYIFTAHYGSVSYTAAF